MDEAAIEAKGLAPLQPTLDRDRRDRATPARLARALGGTIRADVDAFNSTNFETDNLFGLWVAQDLTTRRSTRRSCCRAGSACPIATTTSTRRRG